MSNQWPTRSLRELARFYSGGTPSKAVPNYWNGSIPWISARDMKSMQIKESTHALTSEGAAQVTLTPKGSVLVLVRGMGLFKDLPVVLCDRPVTFNQDIKSLVPRRGVDSAFLAFALIAHKKQILRHVDYAGHGTGRLATSVLGSVRLPVPALSEQKRIAEILRTWNHAIERLRAIRFATVRQHRGVMESVFSGANNLDVGGDGAAEPMRLEELARISMGSSPPSQAYNTHDVGLPLIQGNADLVNGYSSPACYTSVITRTCAPGDILLSVRAPVGPVAVAKHRACIGRGIASIRPKPVCDPTWLRYRLSAASSVWARTSQGSTFAAVSRADVANLQFDTPSLDVQRTIGDLLSAWDDSIHAASSQLELVRRQKRGLLAHLMTGTMNPC